MTEGAMGECLALIEGMFAMCGRPYGPMVAGLYRAGLGPLEDEPTRRVVVGLALGCEWPPKVCEVLAAVARHESPTPSEDDAWNFVHYWCGRVGPPGAPHPLVMQAAGDLGGMDAIWHALQYANSGAGTPVSVVRAQFLKAYERRQADWAAAVQQEIRRPRSERDGRLFPVPVGTKFNPLLAPPTKAAIEAVAVPVWTADPMPEEVRRKLIGLGLGLIAREVDDLM